MEQDAQKNASTPQEEQTAMGFFDHLEELRRRIVLAVIGILLGCITAGFFINELMQYVLLKPATAANLKLQNLRPFGQPFLYFKVILVAGTVIAFPFVLYQLWKFIEPGLYIKEKSWARRITFFTTFCFLTGIAFAYFVMIPGMLAFTVQFGSADIQNIIDVTEYFGFVTTTILGAGLIFELPMICYVLARVGLLSSKTMQTYRRHSIVIILIIAAVLTPSPDPINQLIFAAPLWVLYEISIIITKFSYKEKSTSE